MPRTRNSVSAPSSTSRAANTKRLYAENTRETIRDESIKPLVSAGVVMHNPDDTSRAVNSPKNCYQVEPAALALFRTFEENMARNANCISLRAADAGR